MIVLLIRSWVLSPLLWNLVMNEPLVMLENVGCRVIAYTDNVILTILGPFVSIIRDGMQLDVEKEKLGSGHLVEVWVFFLARWRSYSSRENIFPRPFRPLRLCGVELELKEEAHYP